MRLSVDDFHVLIMILDKLQNQIHKFDLKQVDNLVQTIASFNVQRINLLEFIFQVYIFNNNSTFKYAQKLIGLRLISLIRLYLSNKKCKALDHFKRMKKYQKHIRFQNIDLKVEKQHTKDISRVIFKIIQQNNNVHATKKYGTVNPADIIWPAPIEFKYEAQPSFKFQTVCQHQYGYEIQELKALYYGEIKAKPQDFFHTNNFTVFNKQGQACGKVYIMIKVIDRQVGVKYDQQKQVQSKERFRIDLVGRLNLLSATFVIGPLHIIQFQKRKCIKPTTVLNISIDGLEMIGSLKQHYKWIFNSVNKTEIYQKSEDSLKVQIKQGETVILEGKLFIDTLLKNKRFLVQSVGMANQKGIKIGILNLDMRIVEKKQILDLMYSPKKLQNTKMENTDFQLQSSRISQSLQKSSYFSEPFLQRKNKIISHETKQKSFANKLLESKFESPQQETYKKNRYQIYFRSKYQDSQFSKAKRFPDIKSVNPYVSYSGQNQRSDFSPKRNKSIDFSLTGRTDFTKPYKHNPGIGDYHLPSIWQRA